MTASDLEWPAPAAVDLRSDDPGRKGDGFAELVVGARRLPPARTVESVELATARRRIRELETELAVVRRANEWLKEKTDPRAGGKSSPRS